MADRIHPTQTNTSPAGDQTEEFPKLSSHPDPATEKPLVVPQAYIIKVPKEQIYRYPLPENARRFQIYSRRGKSSRISSRKCLFYTFSLIAVLVLLLAVTAGVLYLVFQPESPKFSVDGIVIRGFNLTNSSPISPEFDITIRIENPNNKISIYYENGNTVEVYYSNVDLSSSGVIPAFYHPSNNLTVFLIELKGSDIVLSSDVNSEIAAAARLGKVPLKVNIRSPVKLKIGAVKTWKMTVKVNCDVTVDGLTPASEIVSTNCNYSTTRL